MKCQITEAPSWMIPLISDLYDENGEVALDEFDQRMDDEGISLWPISINFGELDYDSSESATIELTQRYAV